MVQEIPHVGTRITLDPSMRDRHGMPVIRACGVGHFATAEAVDYMTARAVEWVESAGGRGIRQLGVAVTPQGTEHSAGTTRMGNDPAHSA